MSLTIYWSPEVLTSGDRLRSESERGRLLERRDLNAMPNNGEPGAGVSSRQVFARAGRSAVVVSFFAIAAAPCAIGVAAADDVAPVVSPDRIEDVPSTRADPFPEFDNFAWRAFVALNWPSLTDPAHRGVPDPARTLGDTGPRVWETFKARYELFQVGQDGRPVAPPPWATYDAVNPCGADVDGSAKTLATFDPFMDFNQAAFSPAVAANPLVAQNRTYTRYEVRLNEPEYSALAQSRWSLGQDLPDPAHPARLPAGSIAVKAAWRLLTAADTPMVRALGDEFIRTKVLPQTQLKRLIKPEEIADAICFMITNAAVSGELWADAGWRPAT